MMTKISYGKNVYDKREINAVLKTLKNSGQVGILIMDSHNVGIKNPLKFNEVKRIINLHLKKYKKASM